MKQAFIFGFVWGLLVLSLHSHALLRAGEDAAAERVQPSPILEVTGNYAKVPRPDASWKKGQKVQLYRGAAAAEPLAMGIVTAVKPDYLVLKFKAFEPQVEDVVRLAETPEQETEPDPLVPSADAKSERKTRHELLQERRARLAAQRQAQQQLIQQKWLARVAARGVEPWKPASEREHAAALQKYKRMGQEVHALLPSVQLYETRFFLFYSNIPAEQVAPYVQYLDAMYVMMARLFGIPQGHDVWLGRKAPVFAFLTEEQFQAFESRYFQTRPVGAYGVCHQSSSGEVVIACYRGEDREDFGQMLVHETSHGFVFRYKTKANLPVWVDEGMAEYIGEQMVPGSDAVRNKERLAKEHLKATGRIGQNFFQEDANLAGWQYGAASSMTKFLLGVPNGRQRYVAFLEGMKEGLPWQLSLQQAYGASPQELVIRFGQSIGVPGLQP